MTRKDISTIFADATDEQINALLDINSTDIGNAKRKLESDLATANSTIADRDKTIADLEKNTGDTAALQKIIDEYKAADEQRKADEAAAQARAALETRFNGVLGERKFANDYTRDGVFGEFEKTINADENKGKSDKEIFDALVNDDKGVKPGIFATMNPGGQMRGMGGTPSGDQAYLDDFYKNNPFYKG